MQSRFGRCLIGLSKCSKWLPNYSYQQAFSLIFRVILKINRLFSTILIRFSKCLIPNILQKTFFRVGQTGLVY